MKIEKARAASYRKPRGTVGQDWHVFDDGVLIDSNVECMQDAFTLIYKPVGEVTILIVK